MNILQKLFPSRVMHISEEAFRYVLLLFMVITMDGKKYKATSQGNDTSLHAINYDSRPQRPCSAVLTVNWWRSQEIKLPTGARCILSIHATGAGMDTALALRLSGSQIRAFAPYHGYIWDIARCCDPGKPSSVLMSGSRWLLITATGGSFRLEAFTYIFKASKDVHATPQDTNNTAESPKYSDL